MREPKATEQTPAVGAALKALRTQLKDLGYDEDSAVYQATIAPDADVDGSGHKVPGTGTFSTTPTAIAAYISGIERAIAAG